jgi:group I intron endonuclease
MITDAANKVYAVSDAHLLTPLKKVSGVYLFFNAVTGKSYVGSTKNLASRFREHLKGLRGNRHHSSRFQNSWNKYGEEAFNMCVVETAPIEGLFAREQHYLDLWQCANEKFGYNIKAEAGSSRGYKPSQENRRKHSEFMRARWASSDPKSVAAQKAASQPSEETRAKMSAWGRTGGLKNLTQKRKLATWIHPEHGTHVCGAWTIAIKFKVDQRSLIKVRRGEKDQFKGWRVLQCIK